MDRPYRSPTLRHKRLTAELRRLRAESGLTREQVASQLDWHPTKITRIEQGNWVRLNIRDVRGLLDIYGVTDPEQREGLVQLARESRVRGWWQSYGDVLPSEYATFIGLEAEAASSRTYQQALVPGLLQTEAYARAVIHAARPGDTDDELDRRVAVRMERQRRVLDPNGMHLSAVLSEAVLHQRVGDTKITSDQLRYLADANRRANITIQVLGFDTGAHPALMGSFEILEFPELNDPPVVYLENMVSSLYLETADDVRRYTQSFGGLQATAMSPDDTGVMLSKAAKPL